MVRRTCTKRSVHNSMHAAFGLNECVRPLTRIYMYIIKLNLSKKKKLTTIGNKNVCLFNFVDFCPIMNLNTD